jgi:hypothetical protein
VHEQWQNPSKDHFFIGGAWQACWLWCERKLEYENPIVLWQGNEVRFMACEKQMSMCVCDYSFHLCLENN